MQLSRRATAGSRAGRRRIGQSDQIRPQDPFGFEVYQAPEPLIAVQIVEGDARGMAIDGVDGSLLRRKTGQPATMKDFEYPALDLIVCGLHEIPPYGKPCPCSKTLPTDNIAGGCGVPVPTLGAGAVVPLGTCEAPWKHTPGRAQRSQCNGCVKVCVRSGYGSTTRAGRHRCRQAAFGSPV
jgi:hypothetical protein